MNKRLQKKKSNCKNLVLGSLAWTHVVNGSPVLSVFSQVWDENTVSVWKGYFNRNFKACDPKNDCRYRRATMFHYIDKRVRKQYKKLQRIIFEVSSRQMLLSAKHLIGVSNSCEGIYLDD